MAATKMKTAQVKGGYECLFVEDAPKHLQTDCSVCLCLLRDPQLIDCECGACFCRSCIDPIKAEGKPCPLCNGPFTASMPDRRLQRTLNGLKVYCTYKAAGCTWMDVLGNLYNHLNLESDHESNKLSGCPFAPIECSFCEEVLERRFMKEHELDECPQRPFVCVHCKKFKSTFQDVTDKHVPVCPEKLIACPNECGLTEVHRNCVEDHLLNGCPLATIDCTYHSVGCKVQLLRKDLPKHVADNLALHMSLQQEAMSKEMDQLKTRLAEQEAKNSEVVAKLEQSNALISMLEGLVERLKLEQTSFHGHLKIAPVNLFLAEFAAKRKNNHVWKSFPFYTHPRGYKMCLEIYANGNGDGLGTHVSVFMYLMRGEFDFCLKWPFRGGVFIRLLNQNDTKRYFPAEIRFSEAVIAQGGGRQVTDANKASSSAFGLHQFISHAELAPNYLKNDTLYFEVLSIP